MGWFSRWKNRPKSDAEISSKEWDRLSRVLATIPGLTPIGECVPRTVATVGGLAIEMLSIQSPAPQFHVKISDGTGEIWLIWTGRESLPGIRVGVFIEATGTIGEMPSGGNRTIDPQYSIQVI